MASIPCQSFGLNGCPGRETLPADSGRMQRAGRIATIVVTGHVTKMRGAALINSESGRRGVFVRPSILVSRAKRTHAFLSGLVNVNRNAAPRSAFASAHSRPPCESMMDRQIDRPIPTPLDFVV